MAGNGRRADAAAKPPLEVVAPILAVDSNVRRSGDSRPRAPVVSDSENHGCPWTKSKEQMMSAFDSDACRSGDSRPRAPVTSDSGVSRPRPCGVDVAGNGRRADARTSAQREQ